MNAEEIITRKYCIINGRIDGIVTVEGFKEFAQHHLVEFLKGVTDEEIDEAVGFNNDQNYGALDQVVGAKLIIEKLISKAEQNLKTE